MKSPPWSRPFWGDALTMCRVTCPGIAVSDGSRRGEPMSSAQYSRTFSSPNTLLQTTSFQPYERKNGGRRICWTTEHFKKDLTGVSGRRNLTQRTTFLDQHPLEISDNKLKEMFIRCPNEYTLRCMGLILPELFLRGDRSHAFGHTRHR